MSHAAAAAKPEPNRLEVLCNGLRTIGRAEVAQLLERRVLEPNVRFGGWVSSDWWMSPLSAVSYPQSVLESAFDWDSSPEGIEFWRDIFRDLEDRFS